MLISRLFSVLALASVCFSVYSYAGIEGSVTGTAVDQDGVAVSGAVAQLLNSQGKVLKEVQVEPSGEFQFFPVELGSYRVVVKAPSFESSISNIEVASGANSRLDLHLDRLPEAATSQSQELILDVSAKRRLIQSSASTSVTTITEKQIQVLPLGSETTLPRLITSTTPGVVSGPFGQMFVRGNHANIQYQIDGVQLPDSPSNSFGQAFSPRNIDHMEIITGGVPAEYGQRLGAVVNIITKTGPEKPGGEIELNYGTYNTTSPHLLYGGSNEAGNLHYYFSANYMRTDRGLDTPQPKSVNEQTQGGTESVHNSANGTTEFGRLDWQLNNVDKVSLIGFFSKVNYEIPNYPASFTPDLSFFQPGYENQFGVEDDHGHPLYGYVPYNTNDTQSETNSYLTAVWKHTFSDRSFLMLAPYYKYSQIVVGNDLANDLSSAQYKGPGNPDNSPGATAPGATPINKSQPSSFAQNRHVNNLGLKADYSFRPNDYHLIKTGTQIQASRAEGFISIQRDPVGAPFVDRDPLTGYFESVYIQDDYTIAKPLILNVGLRFDATQFQFSGTNPSESMLQPRIGLNYMATDTTKLHVFYGKLFQPSPVENLRTTFSALDGQIYPYDIKAERDDYYEAGISQQFLGKQVASLTAYYKDGTNVLDDARLLRSSISQPFNFAEGYAYGAEFAVRGQISDNWSEYFNYTYAIAKARGIGGGMWAGEKPEGNDYQYMDHAQTHTANAGLTYTRNRFWWTTQGLFGSGLRTGEGNTIGLPSHLTFDTTVGYVFKGESWYSNFKLSGDVLNIFNNVYPITISNSYNGSTYAAGRMFIVHLVKEF